MGLKRVLDLFLSILLITTLLVPSAGVQAGASASTQAQVSQLFESMTPEERIGQLFVVTFRGGDSGAETVIHDLITNHHIGGVVLLAANDNFAAAPEALTDVHQLIESMQRIEWQSALNPETDPVTGEEIEREYVPLFIGISQEGNGYPTDQILSGMTPLPGEMAIGATWDPELAMQVGHVLGQELSALGFNLYFGPSLDVLETPNIAAGDLGTRVFGGDPFWVGEMGRAYIAGLHTGSQNQLVVIAKHFPGRGGSDRLPEQEVATIRKSLEQLKQIELAPFFAVTGNAPSLEATVDGLLLSHIRYQGFQGNIRATTRPVSFDPQALSQILGLEQFAGWRQDGGLIVSDDLGTRAVRDFYAQGGQTFSPRLTARDALLAGNDLLYLGQALSTESADPYQTTIQILDFFNQKYGEDSAFAQRVDEAVMRILTVKQSLYGNFILSRVLTNDQDMEAIGQSTNITFEVARRSATLISPNAQDLASVMPVPPQLRERLIFITDTTLVRQCSTCPEQPSIQMEALQEAVLRLYGPEGDNQTSTFRVSSYSFEHLQQMLDGQSPPYIETDLGRSDWVILSMTDATLGQPDLISRFLAERQELLRDRRVILFSFGAPYYMDATDISKLTAYFALYSKQSPFIDVAARLLFQELTPLGASPVSVAGVGYDLISAMSPDPNQIISLSLDLQPDAATIDADPTAIPTPVPLFQIGDTIAVRTGVIRDYNGRPVPDGTVVRFSMTLTGEGAGILKQVETVTTAGIARASFGLDKTGLLEIHATSEPAVISEVLRLDVSSSGAAAVTVVVPVLTTTILPTSAAQAVNQHTEYITVAGYPRFSAWLMAVLLLIAGAWLTYWTVTRLSSMRDGIRWALFVILGGLLGYNYLALGLPGSLAWSAKNGMLAVLSITFFGQLLGLVGSWMWHYRAKTKTS
jgi:beta-N-acetylhexosaminidase